MTGVSRDRPELQRLLSNLLEICEKIKSTNTHLKILDLNIDLSSPIGECVLTILGAVAQMEQTTIKERTKEGIAIAKNRGKYKGRKIGAIALNSPDSIERFKRLYRAGLSKSELAREFNVTRPTIYNWIRVLKARRIIK